MEQGLPDFPLDASLGSHFFHNVTSMNIGYFAIPFESPDSFIRFDVLEQQDVIHELTYARRVRFKKPVDRLDGRQKTNFRHYLLGKTPKNDTILGCFFM